MDKENEAMRELLREHGIRPTSSRVRLAEIFLARPQHCSADDLHAQVGKEGRRGVSLATVYNTLNLLAAHGLAREVRVASDRVIFDSNTTPHHHFYNEDTRKLQDIPADTVTINGLPKAPPGTVRQGVDVLVRLRQKKRRRSTDKR